MLLRFGANTVSFTHSDTHVLYRKSAVKRVRNRSDQEKAPRRKRKPIDAVRHVRMMSGVTTGKEILPGVDGRTGLARRYQDIASAVLRDQGGLDQRSEVKQQMIRRYAGVSSLAEQEEAKVARGEDIDVTQYALLGIGS
jgi:hypothetical protein